MRKRFLGFLIVIVLGFLFGIFLVVKDPEFQQLTHPAPLSSPLLIPTPTVLSVASQSGELAVVSKVVDGDTIRLQDGRAVRYIGIDTPELHHPQKAVECFGQEASQRNTELVLGKTVQLTKDVSETDRYGRLLRYVWIDGQLINKQLVSEGFAVASAYPPDIALQPELTAAQKTAQELQKGFWSACRSD